MARYKFYGTKEWEAFRQYIITKRNGLCERCGGAGWIVHHKEYISNININDMSIVYGEDNIELLCQECHNIEHHSNSTTAEGYVFNAQGEIVRK